MKLAAIAMLCGTAMAAEPALVPLDLAQFGRTLSRLKGKVVLFDFWATWCEPCREELPKLVQLERKLAARGFVLVTISADEHEQEPAARRFLEKLGARPPAFVKRVADDDAFINAIDARWSGALPALFLYDRQARRVTSFIGESDPADVERAIAKLL